MGRGEAGFTLMEVLVAIAIMGVSLVLIFSLFSQGLTALHIDEAYSTAVILAKSKMDEVDLLEELADGDEEGRYPGGYRWRREVAETPGPHERPRERRTRLYHIRVTVSWKDGPRRRRVALETLRIGIPPKVRRVGL
ncbi:MAG: prepilin-type N-terminal cleavage/methylation domain-containing protein [Nitrospinota bacterium]